MTQMLLFDSPVPATENGLLPVANSVAQSASQPEPTAAAGETNVAAQLDQDSGLHHMGDLARLVLLRYELVAKRRALLAARKAAR